MIHKECRGFHLFLLYLFSMSEALIHTQVATWKYIVSPSHLSLLTQLVTFHAQFTQRQAPRSLLSLKQLNATWDEICRWMDTACAGTGIASATTWEEFCNNLRGVPRTSMLDFLQEAVWEAQCSWWCRSKSDDVSWKARTKKKKTGIRIRTWTRDGARRRKWQTTTTRDRRSDRGNHGGTWLNACFGQAARALCRQPEHVLALREVY